MTVVKEKKYSECFKSDRASKCNWCNRPWKKGWKIYGYSKPNGGYAYCTDKKCYLEQGGKLTLLANHDVPKEGSFPNYYVPYGTTQTGIPEKVKEEPPLPDTQSDHYLLRELAAKVLVLESIVRGLAKK